MKRRTAVNNATKGIVWGTDGEPGGYSLFRALLPPVPYGVPKYAIRATEPHIASKYEASARFPVRCAAAAGPPCGSHLLLHPALFSRMEPPFQPGRDEQPELVTQAAA